MSALKLACIVDLTLSKKYICACRSLNYKMSSRLYQGDPRIMIDDTEAGNSKLTIMGVLQEDMGTYTCIATNPAGRDQRNVSVIIQREYLN